MASTKYFAGPLGSKRDESQQEYLHLSRILIRYSQKFAEMVEGTLFIEKLMQVVDSDECQCIQNPEFDEGKSLVGLVIVIRHLELGSSRTFNILLEILQDVSPKIASFLADTTHKAWEYTMHHAIGTLKELSFALLAKLSIVDLSSDLKGVLRASELSDILSNETREAQVAAFLSILNDELQAGRMLLWEVFLASLRRTYPKILHKILLKRKERCQVGRKDAKEDEFKRFIDNTEKCRKFNYPCQIISILDTLKYQKKYGIIFDLESKPYDVLIDCVKLELEMRLSQLYWEFLSAMMTIDVVFLSQKLDRCDFALLTLRSNFDHLVQTLDVTCIIQAIGHV